MPYARTLPLLAIAALVALGAPSFADKATTPEQVQKVEAALRQAGFTKWEKIELEDNDVWEVDDAVGSDGKIYDLKLDQALKILDRRPD